MLGLSNISQSVQEPESVIKPILQSGSALVGLLLLGGCSTLDNVSDRASAAASSVVSSATHRDFSNRVYASASAGAALLSPDTKGTQFTFSDRTGGSTQLRLGVDVNSLVSLELDSSILGAASVREVEADVRFTSITSSAVFYGLGNSNNRARRIGWQGYGRLGYSLLQRASVVQPFDGSDSSLLIGAGAEYGFQNGLAIRGEVTRFDSDATLVGIGVVYRLGLSARQFGTAVASVARDAVPTENERASSSLYGEPTLGAALPENTLAPGHISLVNRGPHASLWSNPKNDNDLDGDGVLDSVDICNATERNTAVNQVGCGLFDSVLSEVTFKPSSHWVSPKSKRAIDEVIDVLLAFPEARIEVQAHADNQGPDELNKLVSTARAEAVVKYMLEQGVGEKQLIAKGYGESQPLASNTTAEGRRKNRRIQLLTLPSLTPHEIGEQNPANEGIENSVKTVSKPRKPAATVTIDKAKFNALAKIADGYDGAGGNKSANRIADSNSEPSLAAALPKNSSTALVIKPAVYVPGLGLGGPLAGVSFDVGTEKLNESSKTELNRVSDKLKLYKSVKVALLVHVNEPEDEATNLALSRAQAASIIDYLGSRGIDRRRLIAEPYGDALPVAQTITERDRMRNRRVELRVINPPGR